MVKKVGDKIESEIVGLIRSGIVEPGNRLPSERYLASKFKVSRNTVREAIRALTEKDILISKRGSGSYVTDNARDKIADRIRKTVESKRSELMNIFEIRKMLEPSVAVKAALCANSSDIEKLEEIIRKQEISFKKGANTSALDKEFHSVLVDITGNNVLSAMYKALLKIMEESGISEMQSKKRAESSLNSHKKILDAIGTGDSFEASEYMKKHMDEIEILLIQKIEGSMR